jgi:hypothetical protein
MVAQTIARQLVSVVNTSIWSVRCLTLLCEAFDGVGRLNVTMHHLRKRVKRQRVLLVLNQTSYRFPDSAEYTWL